MRPYRVVNYILLAVMSLTLCGWVLHYGGYAAAPVPVINEVCTSNFCTATDPDGSYLDYIELYNSSDTDYVMEGLHLSNDKDVPERCDLSAVTVPAHGYVILWMVSTDEVPEGADAAAAAIDLSDVPADKADTVPDCPQYYCPFAISRSGDYLYICNGDSKVVGSVMIPALSYDVAYGRAQDGTTSWTGMTPTPGCSNDDATSINLAKADEPVLSASSGFYDEAFSLRIAHNARTRVYYTLDGSTPTTESTLYEGPITIADPSQNANVYSARNDIYLDNYTPEDPVDKAVVVRAIAVDKVTGAMSNVVSATYFIGYDEKSEYDNIAVVSLITDPDNLYDYDTGIYVMGAAADEYVEKGGFTGLENEEIPSAFSDSEGNTYYRYTFTNAENQGRQWERPVTVQLYDADHNLLLSQNAGMRVAGESSRHNVHKSLNLFARSIYGSGTWQYAFWNYGHVDRIRLRASASESLHWKESFVQSLNDGRNVGIQHTIPCAVFLDGEYWGLYQLTEQYGAAYFKGYYDVDEDNLIVYKNHSIVLGDVAQGMQDYEDLEEIITTYDMSQDHLYALAEERVDMDSLIDYYCAHVYLGNTDIWADHNQELWKSTAEDADGRWRYVLYDLDMTGYDAADNTIAQYEQRDTLYWPGYLCAQESFREQYVTTMMDLANVEYSYNRVHALLANKAAALAAQSIETAHRYTDADYDIDDYNEDLTELDNFFRNRRRYIEQYLREDLDLGPIARVTVTNTDVNGGAVQINSSVLTPVDYDEEGCWTGDYYTDYSVTLTAVPSEGYTFAGWSGDVTSSDATITVPLTTKGIKLQAEFLQN